MKITYDYDDLIINLPIAQLRQLEQIIMSTSVKNWLQPLRNQCDCKDVVVFRWYDKSNGDGCKIWFQMDYAKERFMVRNVMHPWRTQLHENEYNHYLAQFMQDIIEPALKTIFNHSSALG